MCDYVVTCNLPESLLTGCASPASGTTWGAWTAGMLAWGFKVAKASRAAVNSLVSLAITRQAASC
mgnify:CR=1 FL=1